MMVAAVSSYSSELIDDREVALLLSWRLHVSFTVGITPTHKLTKDLTFLAIGHGLVACLTAD